MEDNDVEAAGMNDFIPCYCHWVILCIHASSSIRSREPSRSKHPVSSDPPTSTATMYKNI